jgi:membrane-associated phospholipid phosphatase
MLSIVHRKIKQRWAQFGLLSAEMMIVTIAFFGSFIVFVSVAKAIFLDKKKDFDNDVFDAIKPLIDPQTTSVMRSVTVFANHTFLIPANLALIAYFLFVKKNKWYSIKIPAIALSSTAIMFLMKSWFTRNRPEIPLLEAAKGYSFPSGHAFMSFAFYGLLIYLTHKNVKNLPLRWSIIIALLIFIHLIGFSRIYLSALCK